MRQFSGILCALLMVLGSVAQAGREAGNGGDGLEFRLQEAKEIALQALAAVSAERLGNSRVAAQPRNMFLTKRGEYLTRLKTAMFEISDSPLTIRQNEKDKRVEAVALTESNTIKFDRDLCSRYDSLRLMGLLLHETGHLAGYGDDYENDLWQIAEGVKGLWISSAGTTRDPYALKECGNQGDLSERIAHCLELNGDRAVKRIGTYVWRMVSKAQGRKGLQTWFDETSGVTWGPAKWKRELSPQSAIDECQLEPYLDQLPEKSDFEEAEQHGIRQVLPEMDDFLGTKTFDGNDKCNAGASSAWLFDARTGKLSSSEGCKTFVFRCIGK